VEKTGREKNHKLGTVLSVATHPASGVLSKPAFSKPSWVACCLLALITFAVYSPSLKNSFVNYDDEDYVTRNPEIQKGFTSASVRWAVTTTSHSNWHPLTWFSHMLDYRLFGLNPAGHHFDSLLLHALNVALLYLFLAWVTGSSWRSLLVAALFALHPINVESVAWVAERKNVLSMFFFLVTLIAYAWYCRKANIGRYLLIVSCFALALAAKPQVVTLPFVLMLVDYWPLQRIQGWQAPSVAFPAPQRPVGFLVAEKVPLLLMSAASSVITIVAQRGAIYNTTTLPLFPRITNAIFSYADYLWKAAWPLHLAAFYPHWGRFLAWWQIMLSLAFLSGVSIWAWRNRAQGYWPIGWLWFLGTLVPMIGIIQAGQQGMADRYAYLPLIGIFILVVWALTDLAEKRSINFRVTTLASVAVLLSLCILTVRQIATWKSSYDLWSHALKVTEKNYVAEDFIGSAILVDQFKATGQRYSDEAAVHFRKAVAYDPEDSMGRLNLAADLHERGQLKEAIEQYLEAVRTAQSVDVLEKGLSDLGEAYGDLGDYATSRDYYHQALQLSPGNPTIMTGLGKMRMNQRAAELAKSAELQPTAQTYWQLGQLQRDTGHLPEAKSSFQRALQLDPNLSEARDALNQLMASSSHQNSTFDPLQFHDH
jgi:protein O-mannosyl-transferase